MTDRIEPASQDLGHLFRREAGRLLAALTRIFGIHNLALAEDVVQDALCRALQTWKFRGVPEDPAAWLLVSARHRAIDILRRDKQLRRFAPDLAHLLETEWALLPTVDELFQAGAIRDDQLRMMFSCCHPKLNDDASVALMLSLLCGFSSREVAAAFLTEPATIEKRISRARQRLAGTGSLYEMREPGDLSLRLARVMSALYLLFNEGYHGSHSTRTIREELCEESMRLGTLLAEHPVTRGPEVLALLSLMYLHAARLPSRVNELGDLMPLEEQNRSEWNQVFAQRGFELLTASACGDKISAYHVEAAIAAEHVMAPDLNSTNWARIVELYDMLVAIRPSPVVELNRAIALAQQFGPARGLAELSALAQDPQLTQYPFLEAAFGECERRAGHLDLAREHYRRAAALARGQKEREFLMFRASQS